MRKRNVEALTIKSGPTESGELPPPTPTGFPFGLLLIPVTILASVLSFVIIFLIHKLMHR